MDDHSPEAVVERGARWFHQLLQGEDWPTPDEEDLFRQHAVDFMSTLQSGDRLPNGNVVVLVDPTIAIKEAVAAENERAANLIEHYLDGTDDGVTGKMMKNIMAELAAAIRARTSG